METINACANGLKDVSTDGVNRCQVCHRNSERDLTRGGILVEIRIVLNKSDDPEGRKGRGFSPL